MAKRKERPADNQVSDDKIRERAYYIWEKEGRPVGRDLDHWLAAQTNEVPDTGRKAGKRTTATSTRKKASAAATGAESPSGKKKAATKRTKKTSKKP